jgi:hypothetical protein
MPLDPSAADVSTTTADDSAANNNRNPKVGILLLNLGGPEKLDDVEGACVVRWTPEALESVQKMPFLCARGMMQANPLLCSHT